MGYYSGLRKFALGGKGWTVVLGSVVSLSYIRARARLVDDDNSQPYQNLTGERGEAVLFADQPKPRDQEEDIVLRIWRRCPSIPLPNLYIVGGTLTAVWGYRMIGVFNRLMVVRYGDIHYQLKRPDVLANKVVAVKYLALPLGIVPVGALLCCGLVTAFSPADEVNPLRRQAVALRAHLAEPFREAGYLAREAVDPVVSELGDSALASFATRSQTVGRPSMGDITSTGAVCPPAPWS